MKAFTAGVRLCLFWCNQAERIDHHAADMHSATDQFTFDLQQECVQALAASALTSARSHAFNVCMK